MNKNKKLKELKNNYINIEIPNKLDEVVNDALNINSRKEKNKKLAKWTTLAASIGIIVGAVNLSPSFAYALEEIPVIGNVIKIINFKNYRVDENGFDISIEVPKIEGLKDKELEYKLNQNFEEEGRKLYDEYLKEMKLLEEEKIEGRDLVKSWYEVKTDNNDILSIAIFNHHAQGSSNTTRKFYNVDKKNQRVLTLESLFAGTDYINVISENIKEQMEERMKKDSSQVYWIDEEIEGLNFKQINKNQGFYINDSGQLVICFDKYEVGPGSTGLTEFIIPQEITDKIMK